MTEDLTLQLPNLANPPFVSLETRNVPIGQRLINFITNTLRAPVPDGYKASCEKIDSIREQLRNQKELPEECLHYYADYYSLLTGITRDFDITANGANIVFIWGSTSLSLIDFDLCCMGYNVIVGLLKIASRITLNSDMALKSMISAINPAKAICNKILEIHRDDFSAVLTHQQIVALSGFLEAYWVHASLCNALFKNAKLAIVAKLSKLLSQLYHKTSPPFDDLATYFNVLASVKMAEDFLTNKEYGKSIAYGNQAITLAPRPPTQKKKGQPEVPQAILLLQPVIDSFKPKLEQTKSDNKRIYYEPVPEVEEVVACKAPPFPGKFDWNSDIPVTPYNSTVSSNVHDNVIKRLQNFNEQVQNASNDIAQSKTLYPEQTENDMHLMITDLYSKRTLCIEKVEAISNLLGQRVQTISQKCPNAFGQFNQLRPIVDQAAQTDLFFETQLGKAKSLLQTMKDCLQQLNQEQDTLTMIAKQGNESSKEALAALNSTDMTTVLKANTKFNTTFDQLASQLAPLFQKIRASTVLMRTEAERNINPYLVDVETVKGGFSQGIGCYTNLLTQLTNLQNQISSC